MKFVNHMPLYAFMLIVPCSQIKRGLFSKVKFKEVIILFIFNAKEILVVLSRNNILLVIDFMRYKTHLYSNLLILLLFSLKKIP